VTADEVIDLELMLNRFHRLIAELVRGAIARNLFQPWEVDLLLDIEGCSLDPRKRVEILRRYEKAVTRQLETGPGPPMRLSEYLQLKMTRRPSIE